MNAHYRDGPRHFNPTGLSEVETFLAEMRVFQVKITNAGHEQFGAWREGAHDDLVLATALAAWYAEYGNPVWSIPAVTLR